MVVITLFVFQTIAASCSFFFFYTVCPSEPRESQLRDCSLQDDSSDKKSVWEEHKSQGCIWDGGGLSFSPKRKGNQACLDSSSNEHVRCHWNPRCILAGWQQWQEGTTPYHPNFLFTKFQGETFLEFRCITNDDKNQIGFMSIIFQYCI